MTDDTKDTLAETRRRLARFDRQRIKMEAILNEPTADEDERAFMKARLLKMLAVWRAMLEAQK